VQKKQDIHWLGGNKQRRPTTWKDHLQSNVLLASHLTMIRLIEGKHGVASNEGTNEAKYLDYYCFKWR